MISDEVESLLYYFGGLTSDDIVEKFNQLSEKKLTKEFVETILYSLPNRFYLRDFNNLIWETYESNFVQIENSRFYHKIINDFNSQVDSESLTFRLQPPRKWQTEAFKNFKENNYRGIIEAVTGSGKSYVGLLAIRDFFDKGQRIIVVVPTIDLQFQWVNLIDSVTQGRIAIGRLGGGYSSDLSYFQLVVAVINSLRSNQNSGLNLNADLIIADECHRYASIHNVQALSKKIPSRLGLTATLARADRGHLKHLIPFFGSVIYKYKFDQAKEELAISKFEITLLSVDLNNEERDEYDRLSEEIGRCIKAIRKYLPGVYEESADFIKEITEIASGSLDHINVNLKRVALKLLNYIYLRREILNSCEEKILVLPKLHSEIVSSQGTLVFTQTIAMAKKCRVILNDLQLRSKEISSDTDRDVRRYFIKEFSKGNLDVIIAPRVLDEGIDFPDADLAILVASSNTDRQMIQRIGRVVRATTENKIAKIFIIYARDTIEDPALGGHSSFLSFIEHASERITFVDKDDIASSFTDIN